MEPLWLAPPGELDKCVDLLVSHNLLVTDISRWRGMVRALPSWVWGTQSTHDTLQECVDADLKRINRLPAIPAEGEPPLATLLKEVIGRLRDLPERQQVDTWLAQVFARRGAADAPREYPTDLPFIDITALPDPVDPDLFEGREEPIQNLDGYWADPTTTIVPIVAFGGVGKSALVWHWVRKLPRDVTVCRQMFAWSFYSQGQGDYEKDSTKFLNAVREHLLRCLSFWPVPNGETFDLTPVAANAPQRLARELARAFASVGGLLILDGLEPMQNPDVVEGGSPKDLGLKVFLRTLRDDLTTRPNLPRRLLLLTTRWAIGGLREPSEGGVPNGIRELRLENLTPAQGSRLLRNARDPRDRMKKLHFGSRTAMDLPVVEEAFRATSVQQGGHALSLVLLASYIFRRHDGDLANKSDLDEFSLDEKDTAHKYARRMIRCYDEKLFNDPERTSPLFKTCRHVLLLLGLFDRPALSRHLDLLRQTGESQHFFANISRHDFTSAVEELISLRFLNSGTQAGSTLDTHPLIREYFSRRFREEAPAAWVAAHGILYEALGSRARGLKSLPESVDDLEPVFQAVVHGCRAGRQKDVLDTIYVPIILRGKPNEVPPLAGGFGPLLSAISHFFEPGRWDALVGLDDPKDQLTVIVQAGLCLLPIKGYSSEPTGACFKKGLELVEAGYGTPDIQFSVLFGLWRYEMSCGRENRALTLATKIDGMAGEMVRAATEPATRERAAGLERAASLAMSVTQTFRGHFHEALNYARRGTREWTNVRDSNRADGRFLSEPSVTCLIFEAMCLWYTGEQEKARVVGDEAVSLASGMAGHLYNRIVVLYFEAFIHQYLAEPDEADRRVQEVIELCLDEGYSPWQHGATAIRGWAQASRGAVDAGITTLTCRHRRRDWAKGNRAELDAGLDVLRAGQYGWYHTGAGVNTAYWMTLEAEILLDLGRQDEAVKVLREAIGRAEENDDRWWLPESYRMLALCRLSRPELGAGDLQFAERQFKEALREASGQKSLSLELRAVVSLHDLRVSQGRGGETAPLLRDLLAKFPTGDQTHDLTEARSRLAEANP